MELVTRRLLMRPFVDGDLAALADLFADETVRRHLALTPMEAGGAASFTAGFIRGSQIDWQEGGCGALAILPRRGTRNMGPRGRNRVIG